MLVYKEILPSLQLGDTVLIGPIAKTKVVGGPDLSIRDDQFQDLREVCVPFSLQ